MSSAAIGRRRRRIPVAAKTALAQPGQVAERLARPFLRIFRAGHDVNFDFGSLFIRST